MMKDKNITTKKHLNVLRSAHAGSDFDKMGDEPVLVQYYLSGETVLVQWHPRGEIFLLQ